MSSQPIPPYITKYFWGDNLNDLDTERNKTYIVQTLLNIGDRDALRWMFSHYPKTYVAELIPSLKLDPRSRNFWNLYFS